MALVENNKEIIKALASGDKAIFEKVYRYYYQWLCAFGSHYVSLEESEEIVQDTMLWVWENRTSLNHNLSLKSFLFTIVKNKALNQVNHSNIKRRVYEEIAFEYRKEFENPQFYFETELFELYREALNKLDPKLREVYDLTRKCNFTHKQIAEKLHVSHQTVNYRISKALKVLRDELKDYLPLLAIFLLW